MAKKFTQENRPISVSTPLEKDVLLLEAFSGAESLSGLFHFTLDMLADSDTTVPFEKLLGQKVTVTIELPKEKKRYLSGIVSQFSQGHEVNAAQTNTTFIRYRAELVPALWLLTRKVQSRVFQQLAVPDILKKVLTGITNLQVSYKLQGKFEPRDYCVQYRESDLAFASRLMEEEGIYYFFEHSEDGHKMIVANTPQSHPDVPGETKVIFDEVGGAVETQGRVHGWEKTQELRSGKYTLWDYTFEMPDKNLSADQTIQETSKAGTITHKFKAGGNDEMEIYDFPGAYAQRFDGIAPGGGSQSSNLQKIFQDNKRTVEIRMQQEALQGMLIEGRSDCRQFIAGSKFTLDRHFNGNGAYVLTRVEHEADMRGTYTSGARTRVNYHNKFRCLPSDVPFRPLRSTPRPLMHGTQSAVVVGPSGQEIFTDKYGRVKVQFRWDREGKKDQDSSCWIRVATPWAGKNWGLIHIPRIGQEVVVAFEEGDPDQPIIVGSVYNFENMPPYVLPDYMTMSGLKTRSTLKGETANFNELRFEDKKDQEEVYFHAEKDFNRVVENNDTLKVGSDKADDGSQTIEIYKNRTETVKTGDETVTLEQGSRTHNIKKDDTLKVEGKQTLTITGDRTMTIQQGNQSTKVEAGTVTVEAAQSITLKVGANSIKIDTTGVTITAAKVAIQAQGQAQMQGATVQIQGTGAVQITAPSIQVG
jgi:type VI secretion system secreted protein VgrG